MMHESTSDIMERNYDIFESEIKNNKLYAVHVEILTILFKNMIQYETLEYTSDYVIQMQQELEKLRKAGLMDTVVRNKNLIRKFNAELKLIFPDDLISFGNASMLLPEEEFLKVLQKEKEMFLFSKI